MFFSGIPSWSAEYTLNYKKQVKDAGMADFEALASK